MPQKDSSNLFNATGNRFLERQARLASLLQKAGVDALAINPGPTLTYLTGLHFHLMERPVVAFLIPHQSIILVLPELELAKTEHLSYPLLPVPYPEDPLRWLAAFSQAVSMAKIQHGRIAVEPSRLRVLELRFLQAAAEKADFPSGENLLAELRMQKDVHELAAMRKAVEIAQRGLQATIPSIRRGVSEQELASELTLQLLRAGSNPEFPFTPIVSTGPNSANPHASPSSRALSEGDLLVIDWGATWEDYISDLTRTFGIGNLDAEFIKIAEIVKESNAAGLAAARPGVTAGSIDRAARTVIENAGYGHYFTHRTGHGVGMEGHEPPYIRGDNPLVLEPGMTFTIEPGIYLPGKGGVRIEDNVVITHDGAESLSDLPRDLFLTP